MKKGSNIAVFVIILAIVATGAGIAITRAKNTKQPVTTESTKTTSDTTNALVKNVSIVNSSFSPVTVTIKVGGTVTWTNEDDMNHTVTADATTTESLNSILLSKGTTYSYIFNKAGTYTYHCQVHSTMTGTIIVTK